MRISRSQYRQLLSTCLQCTKLSSVWIRPNVLSVLHQQSCLKSNKGYPPISVYRTIVRDRKIEEELYGPVYKRSKIASSSGAKSENRNKSDKSNKDTPSSRVEFENGYKKGTFGKDSNINVLDSLYGPVHKPKKDTQGSAVKSNLTKDNYSNVKSESENSSVESNLNNDSHSHLKLETQNEAGKKDKASSSNLKEKRKPVSEYELAEKTEQRKNTLNALDNIVNKLDPLSQAMALLSSFPMSTPSDLMDTKLLERNSVIYSEFLTSLNVTKLPSVTKILSDTMSEKSKLALKKWEQKMIAELGWEGFQQYKQRE